MRTRIRERLSNAHMVITYLSHKMRFKTVMIVAYRALIVLLAYQVFWGSNA